MEKKRELNISFGKSGKGSISPRLNIPKKFLDVLEITQENRSIILELDEEKKVITITKKQD